MLSPHMHMLSVPATRRGRNIVIRNHVNSLAWYLVQAQTPPDLKAMMGSEHPNMATELVF